LFDAMRTEKASAERQQYGNEKSQAKNATHE
jgi:hypothetical protein